MLRPDARRLKAAIPLVADHGGAAVEPFAAQPRLVDERLGVPGLDGERGDGVASGDVVHYVAPAHHMGGLGSWDFQLDIPVAKPEEKEKSNQRARRSEQAVELLALLLILEE
ncbi:MAG: hypothetical protein HY378_01530 [Candidatus Brennerbacteria bacterium]|nr:hypothetical protein [Candidatus Brennerbacteria bacterium]